MLVNLVVPPRTEDALSRSEIQWMARDGERLTAGTFIGYASLELRRRAAASWSEGEEIELQVAFALPADGVLSRPPGELGGWWNVVRSLEWAGLAPLAKLEVDGATGTAMNLRPVFMTGRRRLPHVDVKGTLAAGWCDRTRAWWGTEDGTKTVTTLLAMGICEQFGVIRGAARDFQELVRAVPGPFHVVYNYDDVVVPSSRSLLSQMRRTDEERLAIRADLLEFMASQSGRPEQMNPGDLGYFATLLASLLHPCPATDEFPLVDERGFRSARPDILLLSLHSEFAVTLAHQTLGFEFSMHGFRYKERGPLLNEWMRRRLRRVERSVAQVAMDLEQLVAEVRARSNATIAVINTVTSDVNGRPPTYGLLEPPFTPLVVSKEYNLMLDDVARKTGIVVVDADRIAAEHGVKGFGFNRIHAGGEVEALLRQEVVALVERHRARR